MKAIVLVLTLIILNGFVLVDATSFGYSSTEDFTVNVNTYVGNLTNLSEMADVNIPTPTDEQVLSYNSATSKWVSSTLSYISKWVIDTANGFFYTSGNILYFNDTLLNNTIDDRAVTTESDPIYTAQNTTIARTGDCPDGQVVMNITTGGVECIIAAGDILSVQGDNIYIYNGSDSGNVLLSFNETKLNSSVEAFGYITSFSETDPYWTANQSSYSTTAEILAFGYYNSSDFIITDYFTKTQIGNFNYYNSTDFNISDYLTSSEILAFDYYNSSDFDISDYITSATLAGYNYYNSSDFNISDYATTIYVDSLGNFSTYIQPTHLTNFTDDILWTTDFNSTFDSRDSDTTYDNGTGLSLTGTTFSIVLSYFTDKFIELTDSFGGDVSGTYDNLQVSDDSHEHAYQNITNEPWIDDSELPLANKTTPYCGNITGATSNLCTLTDTDTTYSHLSNFTDDLGDRGYTDLVNFTNSPGYITNSTMNKTVDYLDIIGEPTHLTNFTDDLGDRGYTSNSNFTNDAGYYNLSDFDIGDYYLLSNPYEYYNSTTIPNYILSSDEENLNVNSSDYWDDYDVVTDLNNLIEIAGENITSGTIGFARLPTLDYLVLVKWANITDAPTALSFFSDDLGDRGYTHLTNFTDDLGDRGYTHLSNFSNDLEIGNWSEDSVNYYNTTQVDTEITNANTSMKGYVDGTFITQANEGNLNVNSSDYWDDYNTANSTWFQNIAGALSLKLSQLTTWTDGWLSGKTTDDLTEGSVNLYDNKSWNESHADTLYYDLSNSYGYYNSSNFNISDYATTTYADSLGNFSAWDKDYADLINTPTLLSNFTDDLGDRGYTDLVNFTNSPGYITNTTMNKTVDYSDVIGEPTHLTNFTDDLGDRGYTNNLNFTNGAGYFNLSDFDISNYYTSTETDTEITNANTSMKTYVDGTFRLDSWDNFTGIPTATPSDGDTTHLSTADQIYDWVIGLGYATTTYVDDLIGTYTHLTNFTDDLGDRGYTSVSNFTNDLGYYNSSDFIITDYSTTAEVLGFNYYNATDFVITDYFTKANIESFGYYNSSDFSIGDYSTTTQMNTAIETANTSMLNYVDGAFLTSETDPYWTANQSSYSTTAEIFGFSYYNATDFVITDYFTKANIEGFGYYNSSDFSIADYSTTAEAGALYATIDEPLWTANQSSYSTKAMADGLYADISVVSNPFDQELNTTSNVEFNNVTVDDCIIGGNGASLCFV